jgi:hypothetical protein
LSAGRPSPILLLLALALTIVLPLTAAFAQPTEQAVKAAFIPKFARYVEWPAAARPGSRDPFQLCVIGRDPFGTLLDQAAASEVIEGHRVAVRRLRTAEGSDACHLAFVRGASSQETGRLLSALRARPVLTITDSRAGPARGMIHFTNSAGRVRFFIDEAEASEHGLSISSRLLALALGVRQRRT